MGSWLHYSWARDAKVGDALAKAVLILLAQDMNDLDYRCSSGVRDAFLDPFSGLEELFAELEVPPSRGWAIIADLLDRGFLVVHFGLVTGAPEPPVDLGPAITGKRRAIFERDGWKCAYCGSGENLSLDHVVPRARGGGDEPSNLRTACRSCNSSKGARDLHVWLATRVGDVI